MGGLTVEGQRTSKEQIVKYEQFKNWLNSFDVNTEFFILDKVTEVFNSIEQEGESWKLTFGSDNTASVVFQHESYGKFIKSGYNLSVEVQNGKDRIKLLGLTRIIGHYADPYTHGQKFSEVLMCGIGGTCGITKDGGAEVLI